MKVYVAKFYAVNDEDCAVRVFLSKEKAEAFCKEKNEELREDYNEKWEDDLGYDEFICDKEDVWGVEEAEVEE